MGSAAEVTTEPDSACYRESRATGAPDETRVRARRDAVHGLEHDIILLRPDDRDPPAGATSDPERHPRDDQAMRFQTPTPEQRREMIAIAAYYLAERRGFAPGGAENDWFRAEGAIDAMLAAHGFEVAAEPDAVRRSIRNALLFQEDPG